MSTPRRRSPGRRTPLSSAQTHCKCQTAKESTQARHPRGQAGARAQPGCGLSGRNPQPGTAALSAPPETRGRGRPINPDVTRHGRFLPPSCWAFSKRPAPPQPGQTHGVTRTTSCTPPPCDPPSTCTPAPSQSRGSAREARHKERSSRPAITSHCRPRKLDNGEPLRVWSGRDPTPRGAALEMG